MKGEEKKEEEKDKQIFSPLLLLISINVLANFPVTVAQRTRGVMSGRQVSQRPTTVWRSSTLETCKRKYKRTKFHSEFRFGCSLNDYHCSLFNLVVSFFFTSLKRSLLQIYSTLKYMEVLLLRTSWSCHGIESQTYFCIDLSRVLT